MGFRKKSFLIVILFLFVSLICGEGTRRYLMTGNWYPASESALDAQLNQFFKKSTIKKIPGRVRALISPHAGFVYSGLCAARAYKQLENLKNIKRIFIFGVSHRGGFYGACVSDFSFNSTPLGKIPVDTVITKKLAREKFFMSNNSIMEYEHSIETQLPFLQKTFKSQKYKIVPILFGRLRKSDFKTIANMIKRYVDANTIIIASTDLTHYGRNFGYVPFKTNIKNNLTKLDMGIIKKIQKMDFEGYHDYAKETGITMCGFVPVGVLLNIFPETKYSTLLVDYYKSGDFNNDYSLSVSYASLIIHERGKKTKNKNVKKKNSPVELSSGEKNTLLTIARKTLNTYLEKKEYPEAVENKHKITSSLKRRSGVFVTLRVKGHLRGCIGSIIGRKPLYQGVMENAVKAAVSDPRFKPVKTEELKNIDIEISVMTPLQRIDDYKKIRLGTDGVIIKKGYKQAVYLPQVATETGWNLDEFLSHLCQKAGLFYDAYKSKEMEFYIFQALVFEEKELKNEI